MGRVLGLSCAVSRCFKQRSIARAEYNLLPLPAFGTSNPSFTKRATARDEMASSAATCAVV